MTPFVLFIRYGCADLMHSMYVGLWVALWMFICNNVVVACYCFQKLSDSYVILFSAELDSIVVPLFTNFMNRGTAMLSTLNNLQHVTFNHGQAVASLIDCPTDNMNELVSCLKVFTFTFYACFLRFSSSCI